LLLANFGFLLIFSDFTDFILISPILTPRSNNASLASIVVRRGFIGDNTNKGERKKH